MPKRIAITTLDASTIDILNTIRANASAEYQNLVPEISTLKEIPLVGETIYGYPALANQFISALVNRIALVKVNSATFNNAYAKFKKGYLEFGETVEEVFVGLCKAREFNVEKAPAREFKRTIPDVKSVFHAMNYRVQYPITIQDEDLRMAFTSAEGVRDLIAKIVGQVYTSNEYDEYLLFKYLLIKSITKGKLYPVPVDMSDIKNAAITFRGVSNTLPFIKTQYNHAGVHTNTKKEEQEIFMDATFNAQFDVEVLSSAFNMDKADFIGRLNLIDDWTTFDNERFEDIRANSDCLEEVTDAELNLMKDVVAVIVDPEWFQVYDNLNKMTEKYVASGMYWNYFYNVWKTVDTSPFSNAVVFVKSTATTTNKNKLTGIVKSVSVGDTAGIITIDIGGDNALAPSSYEFIQDEHATEQGIAVHKYGAYIVPLTADATGVYPKIKVGNSTYTGGTALSEIGEAGTEVTFTLDT